jgi:hypothetical protein
MANGAQKPTRRRRDVAEFAKIPQRAADGTLGEFRYTS